MRPQNTAHTCHVMLIDLLERNMGSWCCCCRSGDLSEVDDAKSARTAASFTGVVLAFFFLPALAVCLAGVEVESAAASGATSAAAAAAAAAPPFIA